LSTQDIPLEGNVTFKVYPDESIKVEVVGAIEQALETNFKLPPVDNVVFNLISSPRDKNRTDIKGSFQMKLSPMYSVQLSALDLNIEVHSEDLGQIGARSNTTILFNFPGYLGISGTTGTFTDKASGESILEFDFKVTLGYTFYPKENIQQFVQTFPILKSQLASQINELTEGNITLQDFTLVSSEIRDTLATLIIKGRINGDLGKGLMALSTEMTPAYTGASTPSQTIDLKELRNIRPKSGDLYLMFDKNEMAFKMDSEIVLEGDIDRHYNVMKDLFCEGFLQSPQTTQEMADSINDFLLPTELSIVNLNIFFEYLFDGEKYDLGFEFDGLGFKPPMIETFLRALDETFSGVSMPGFSLTLEGESDEKEFVEIIVPSTISEPVSKSPRKVVWIVDNLVNINHISFKVREWPILSSTVTQSEVAAGESINIEGVLAIDGEPLAEHKVDIMVNDIIVNTFETDLEGGFSYTHKFENPGSYEVKAQFKYHEKTLEAPITKENVKSSSLSTPMTTSITIAGVIAVAVIGYILIKKR
jgi:hypothetical protein